MTIRYDKSARASLTSNAHSHRSDRSESEQNVDNDIPTCNQYCKFAENSYLHEKGVELVGQDSLGGRNEPLGDFARIGTEVGH